MFLWCQCSAQRYRYLFFVKLICVLIEFTFARIRLFHGMAQNSESSILCNFQNYIRISYIITKSSLNEQRYEKTGFLLCENKRAQISCAVTADERLCFRFTDSTIPHILVAKISRF